VNLGKTKEEFTYIEHGGEVTSKGNSKQSETTDNRCK